MLLRAILGLALVLDLGCSARSSEDADGSTSEGDSGGDDVELNAICGRGCERFAECAPDPFMLAHGDHDACVDNCLDIFAAPPACREAAGPYADCTYSLACEDWADLLDDPATSPCAPEWAVVSPACGLG